MNFSKKNLNLVISAFVFYLIVLFWATILKCNNASPIQDLKAFLGPMTISERFVYATSHFSLKDDSKLVMALNVLIFIPYGIYIPLLRGRAAPITTTILAFLSTLFIECTQLILALGYFTYSDLILNTSGAVIGMIIYSVFIKRMKEEHKKWWLSVLTVLAVSISIFAIINTALNIEIYL